MESKLTVRIIHTNNDYDEIKSLLRIAIEHHSTYKDRYVKIIVRDAQIIKKNPDRIKETSREFRSYSRALSASNSDAYVSMNPNELTKDNLETLLEIFNSL